jgi:ribosome biogenesis protein ENP2
MCVLFVLLCALYLSPRRAIAASRGGAQGARFASFLGTGLLVFQFISGRCVLHFVFFSCGGVLSLPEFRNRLELLQDFHMPVSTGRIQLTPDLSQIVATGVYKPQVKVWDLSEQSIKFERHMNAEAVDFAMLGQNFAKMAFLHTDRTLTFHASFGHLYRTRVPRHGRSLRYDQGRHCMLYVGGTGEQVHRLSLCEGRFAEPLETGCAGGVNALAIEPEHGLVLCAGVDGTLEAWDPRAPRCAGRLESATGRLQASGEHDPQGKSTAPLSAVCCRGDGLTLAVGSAHGAVAVYDMRSARPLASKDHRYGCAVHTVSFPQAHELHCSAEDPPLVLSACSRIMKLWHVDGAQSRTLANVQSEDADFNQVVHYPRSGLLMAAGECSKIRAYYVPALGPAPAWCSHLDSITEEMEERGEEMGVGADATTTVYDDYKFATREDLAALGLDRLVGTSYLRAYMHGFFIHMKLYSRARALANPTAYHEHLKQRVRERIAERSASRIRQPKASVNRLMQERVEADRLRNEASGAQGGQVGVQPAAGGGDATSILADDRFSLLTRNPDFELDPQHPDFAHMESV